MRRQDSEEKIKSLVRETEILRQQLNRELEQRAGEEFLRSTDDAEMPQNKATLTSEREKKYKIEIEMLRKKNEKMEVMAEENEKNKNMIQMLTEQINTFLQSEQEIIEESEQLRNDLEMEKEKLVENEKRLREQEGEIVALNVQVEALLEREQEKSEGVKLMKIRLLETETIMQEKEKELEILRTQVTFETHKMKKIEAKMEENEAEAKKQIGRAKEIEGTLQQEKQKVAQCNEEIRVLKTSILYKNENEKEKVT